jgi:hypothetical protein
MRPVRHARRLSVPWARGRIHHDLMRPLASGGGECAAMHQRGRRAAAQGATVAHGQFARRHRRT